jgi:hypothetical protein
MKFNSSIIPAISIVVASVLITVGLQAASSIPVSVLTLAGHEAQTLPAVTKASPAYYVLQIGEYHDTGWPARTNEVTREDLDEALQTSLAMAGFLPADDRHAPALAIVYHWGQHNLPESNHPGLGETLFSKNVLERAALVGGRTFATGLKAAMVDASVEAKVNGQGLSGNGGPAAQAVAAMAALTDPVSRFREKNPKNRFMFRQAMEDCYFLIVSAFAYDANTGKRGALQWRTTATIGARQVAQRQAYPTMALEAASSYGVAMTEPQTLHLKKKDLTTTSARISAKD